MEKNIPKLNPKKFFHKRVIIDNSVLIKFFVQEEGRQLAIELLKMAAKRELSLFAPPLLKFELLNVLSNIIKNSKEVHKAYLKFKKLNISLIEPSEESTKQAIEDSCNDKDITYYDASYSALADDLEATFITADRKYYELMKHRGNIALLC